MLWTSVTTLLLSESKRVFREGDRPNHLACGALCLHVEAGAHSMEEVRSCAVCEHFVSLKERRENTALIFLNSRDVQLLRLGGWLMRLLLLQECLLKQEARRENFPTEAVHLCCCQVDMQRI
jgi:hypothetical protein